MKLNELRDNSGARYKSKRVGRGIGSGKGKTSGSGHKGQNARSGVAIKNFEGGQMPLYRRLPKRGFTSLNKTIYEVINLQNIEKLVADKKLDPKNITIEGMVELGIVKDGMPVKLLGKGDISCSVNIEVNQASKSALKKVEDQKGKVTLLP